MRVGSSYLVGGRKTVDSAAPRTTLYWLDGDRLVEALELPGGDNSYPGFRAGRDAWAAVVLFQS